MDIRGIPGDRRCVMCSTCSMETLVHILFYCEYAGWFWRTLKHLLGVDIVCKGNSMGDTVTKSHHACRSRLTRRKWGVYFFSGCWIIWKERNNKIFRNCCVDPFNAAAKAHREALRWLKYC